jgi:hypothetical protein
MVDQVHDVPTWRGAAIAYSQALGDEPARLCDADEPDAVGHPRREVAVAGRGPGRSGEQALPFVELQRLGLRDSSVPGEWLACWFEGWNGVGRAPARSGGRPGDHQREDPEAVVADDRAADDEQG